MMIEEMPCTTHVSEREEPEARLAQLDVRARIQ
jgi:hypothetical protein